MSVVLQARECLRFRTVSQEHWLINEDCSRRARNYNEENQTRPFRSTHSVKYKKVLYSLMVLLI